MRNFLRSTSFKILLTVVVVLLAGAIAAAALASGTSPLTSAVGTVFSPLSDAAAYISEKFDNFKGGFISSRSYMDRVEELEEQVADYQSKLVDYEKLQKQVEAYEKFLGVKEKNPDFQFVAGTVIGRDAADVFGSFVLNCGSADGVAVGDPVISGEYLIGIVNETSPTSCTVLSVCDPKFSAAAYEIRTGEAGYTQTTTKLGVQGVLKLSGLERHRRCRRRHRLHFGCGRRVPQRFNYRHGHDRSERRGRHFLLRRSEARNGDFRGAGRFRHHRF